MIVRLLRPSVFHHRSTPSRAGPCPRAGVGPARVLDLDDVGAEVTEERRGQRPGEQRRRVEDAQSGQRTGCGVALVHRCTIDPSYAPKPVLVHQ